MQPMVRRGIVILIAPLLLWTTWGRSEPEPAVPGAPLIDAFTPLTMPAPHELARYLGPFRLDGAWHLKSRHDLVYGYSALIAKPDGRFLAFNDAGDALSFAPPGTPGPPPRASRLALSDKSGEKASRDIESATRDPATGGYRVGLEGVNAILRLSPGLKQTGGARPPAMQHWALNTGAEAMTRLPDGRFVTIREVTPSWGEARLHEAVLFAGDPVAHPDGRRFRFDGPDNFSVVDMALLPDGRALILMRRLLWPLPMRFAGRIVIADTAKIRAGETWHSLPLASLASTLPVDNFEAIAAVPQDDGRVTVWLMSDDNHMRVLQRTLLWKLSVDPARLPWPD